MTKRSTALAIVPMLALLALPAGAQTAPAKHPDFTGIWNSSTATPVERPVALGDKAFYTPAEAAEFEKRAASRNVDNIRPGDVGTYNVAWREFGTHPVKTLRTSIVTDPPDGRLPALTPAAAKAKAAKQAGIKHPNGAEDTGLQDQCLLFSPSAPPMMPYSYNSNYQFLLTPDALVIESEFNHETRVIALNGRKHPPANVRFWLGDSVGHWEGDTLVVDSTNFNDQNGFYGDAGGVYGWDRNLHVVERFSLMDAETILYRFEIDDATAYTKPWKGELTMSRSTEPIYEFACHEGNSRSLEGIFSATRAEEKARKK